MYLKAELLILALLLVAGTSAHSAVVWSDEFDGTEIDTDTWTWDVASHGFGNGQMEYTTSRATNSYIESGSLVLQALQEDYFGKSFTSARLNTQGRFAFKYGTLEARIQLPDTADGLWPAFWLLGNNFPGVVWPDCGEIDIRRKAPARRIQIGRRTQGEEREIRMPPNPPLTKTVDIAVDAIAILAGEQLDLSYQSHPHPRTRVPHLKNRARFLSRCTFVDLSCARESLREIIS